MRGARLGEAATAVGTLKSLRFPAEAPAGATAGMRAKLKPTNHMRPSGGGAFPLPSVVGVLLPNALHALPPATARREHDRDLTEVMAVFSDRISEQTVRRTAASKASNRGR